MVAKLLPKALERIGEAATRCENLVLKTEEAFVFVMALTDEIGRSVATVQGENQQEIFENGRKISYTDILLNRMNKSAEDAKQTYNLISAEV